MGASFFGLNIGQSGLYAYQAALNTTAHNITNAETKGYSKQVAGQQAGKAQSVNSTYGMAGTGVEITGVTQLRDSYYDVKYWENSTIYGEYETKNHYMTEVENYFNEMNEDGFTTTINSLYSSLQELQKNPSSLTVRTQLVNYAQSLGEYFNATSQSLKSIQEEVNFEIRNQVDQINSTAQQIATVTKQINTLESRGGTANDLRDQRALLIDEISKIAKVTVDEKVVGDNVGVTSYIVKLDNQTIVDGINFNKLKVIPREVKDNQNDAKGLYDVTWENGQTFNLGSSSLGGNLQALYEVRDGNNLKNLQGTVSAEVGDTFVTMTNTTINTVEELNIPQEGKITVGNRQYNYKGFQVSKDDNDKFVYKFEIEDQVVTDAVSVSASIGKSINFKGIPYYMDQMNEFIRTYSKAINDIHRTGEDLDKKSGIDIFTAKDKVTGRDYRFGPLEGSSDQSFYDYDTFNSRTGSYEEEVSEKDPFYGSYYFMTAENYCVSSELQKDPSKLATATDVTNGKENNDVVDALLATKDSKIFKSGAPTGFFQTLVAEIGIDTKKSSNFTGNQEDILKSIENQRLSISGVDAEEEAMNLVKFQNAYNLSAKVISVMDEIYDKLINYMGA